MYPTQEEMMETWGRVLPQYDADRDPKNPEAFTIKIGSSEYRGTVKVLENHGTHLNLRRGFGKRKRDGEVEQALKDANADKQCKINGREHAIKLQVADEKLTISGALRFANGAQCTAPECGELVKRMESLLLRYFDSPHVT